MYIEWLKFPLVSQPSEVPRIYEFVHLMSRLRSLTAFVTIYAVVVMCPLLVLLSHFFGTHHNVYAYSASAAYLSGI